MTHRVQLVELHKTSRWDKISPKLAWHNYKTISSHEGTCSCNISLGHEPVIFSSACVHLVILPVLHVASVCTIQVFFFAETCPCNKTSRVCPPKESRSQDASDMHARRAWTKYTHDTWQANKGDASQTT